MDLLDKIFVAPFRDMVDLPDILVQTLWEGFVAGILYALIALGFVLIYRSSRIFNFAQGVMVVFASLAMIWFNQKGIPAWIALALALVVMLVMAIAIERIVLRPLIGQPDIILFMATIGITLVLIGIGEWWFGGENQAMITDKLGVPGEQWNLRILGGRVSIRQQDVAAVIVAILLVAGLLVFLNRSQMGRAIRALSDDAQAALSVGISLHQIWVLVWFLAGVIALVTGIAWGARVDITFNLQVIAYKALPVLMLGGLDSISGAIVGGLLIGILEKLFEIYWAQPIMGGGSETWFAFVLALIVLLFRPQGLFGEKIIERV